MNIEAFIKSDPITQRVKIVTFDRISGTNHLERLLKFANVESSNYTNPLVQVRFVGETRRVQEFSELALSLHSSDQIARVLGVIPFTDNSEDFGIFYMQTESPSRKSFRFQDVSRDISHHEAVRRGLDKRNNFIPRPLDPNFEVFAADYSQGEVGLDILNSDRHLPFEREELIEEIARVHKLAFDYPHDQAQRERDGIEQIVVSNPIILAVDRERRRLAAVGFIEQDDRFNFAGCTLVEPTYFTDPDYENRGLSVALRLITQDTIKRSEQIASYRGSPIILFNESIRATSFPLCLQVGCELGGDLGDAYTYIGPANPQTGLMPMAFTYFVDPRIRSK